MLLIIMEDFSKGDDQDKLQAYSKYEVHIKSVLNGDRLKRAMDFFGFLKDNEMVPSGSHGEVFYGDQCICAMHLDGVDALPGPWTIWTIGDYSTEQEGVALDEQTKQIAWKNVNVCGNYGGCSPGSHQVIFGKEYDNICSSVIAFVDPDAETLECAKKLVLMKKVYFQNKDDS